MLFPLSTFFSPSFLPLPSSKYNTKFEILNPLCSKNLDKMNFFRNYYFFISNIFIYCSICILINGCITFCILDKGGSLMNINKLLLIIIRRRQIAWLHIQKEFLNDEKVYYITSSNYFEYSGAFAGRSRQQLSLR